MKQGYIRRGGFTIVELLIVVVVISILAAITVVTYGGITGRAKDAALASSLQQAAKKVATAYTMNADAYPATLEVAGIADTVDISYQYTSNMFSPEPNYCITATQGSGSGTKVSHIAGVRASINGAVGDVPCNGHQGYNGMSTTLNGTTVTSTTLNCPANFVAIPGNSLYDQASFCMMKYEAKDIDGVAVSRAAGTPWVSISQVNAISAAQSTCEGCHLTSDSEWLTAAFNILHNPDNWSGGAVGEGYVYTGHTDITPASTLAAGDDLDPYSGTGNSSASGASQRRTHNITNGEVIWDLAGNAFEWTAQTTQGVGSQLGLAGMSYEWREHTAVNLKFGNFASSLLAFGMSQPGIATWSTADQKIGRIHSSNTDGDLRAARRGGSVGGGINSGVLSLLLGVTPSYVNPNVGFRVAR